MRLFLLIAAPAALVSFAIPAAAQVSGRTCDDGYLRDPDGVELFWETGEQVRCVRGYVDGQTGMVIVTLAPGSVAATAVRPVPRHSPRSDYGYYGGRTNITTNYSSTTRITRNIVRNERARRNNQQRGGRSDGYRSSNGGPVDMVPDVLRANTGNSRGHYNYQPRERHNRQRGYDNNSDDAGGQVSVGRRRRFDVNGNAFDYRREHVRRPQSRGNRSSGNGQSRYFGGQSRRRGRDR